MRYPVLVPNEQGLERAVAAGADAMAVFTGGVDAFTAHNIDMSIDDRWTRSSRCSSRLSELGWWRRGYVSAAFGCPYRARSTARVVRVAAALFDLGCEEVCDRRHHRGRHPRPRAPGGRGAWPTEVPLDRIALHLHDTQGTALANVEAGLEQGVPVFDASTGGTGGCPYAPGAPGNLATEELVWLLEREGIEHGVDADRLDHIAASLREVLAR